MRVCLISPPYDSAVKSVVGVSSPPLGLAYIASMLRQNHDVKIIDSNILNYTLEDVERELRGFNPDVVGITSVTPSIYEAYKVAEIAKKVNEGCTVVLGGPHATFTSIQTLKECKHIDVIVKGEGEETVRELVEKIERGAPLKEVKGITFRKQNEIIDTEPRPFVRNIDAIPFPSWDLLPMHLYKFNGIKYATMLTSRGCPFRCSFCSSSRLFGGYWRGRSPENVLEEIKILYDRYGIRNIEFLDDTFTFDQERAERICNEIIKEGLDISWGASSRVDTLSKELVERMKKAGCWIVFLGIESGSQKILDAIGKRITLGQIKMAVKILKDAGIQVLGSFIIGFLEDTKETIKETIRFAKSLDLDYAEFSILTPYPGTPVYEYAKKNNMLLTEDWSKYTAVEPVLKIEGVSEKEVKALFQKAYITFYLRPKMALRWLKNKQFGFIKSGIKAVISYLKRRGEQ
ncbi:MAG: B12-binding domain-containing radical SAM protein [Candidatus Terraquivivens tikiterensis]|uniref:B12-binding domain-containing radical SAM protein n=1 Tax=Candidatus Terraquivivens tikiterensis TaxID=1980982 RepID=A0A2R7YA65_9ARCH|nr:MAG: B12-binding domain-containing radical SAM protein [Candidatus Terraquivivens tikiterensis]